MNRTSTRAGTVGKWGIRAALALLAVYVLYLIAANVWINTALGERTINRKPDRLQMHWAGGHSWWPGAVSLREVRLQGQVRRLAWQAQAGQVSGRIALWPLLRRELHVPFVRAEQVSGGVARAAHERPAPAPRDGGWVLRFDRIVSDSVREGHFDGLQLDGAGRAQVGFVKQLRGGPLELLPSRASFRQARLRLDGREMLREAVLEADFAIARHRREEAPGLRKLLKTEARLRLHGATSAIDLTPVPGGLDFALVPGRGQAQIDLGFSKGELTPGSRLQWSMPVGGSDASGAARSDALGIALAVDRDIVLKLKAPPLAESRMSVDADLRLRGRQVPLGDFRSLLPRASGHVVGRWRFSSLQWLGSLFPQAPWLRLDGAGDVDADVQVVNGQLAAGSRIGVPEVDAVADVMGNRIRGRAHADIRLEAGPQGQLLPRLRAVMEQFHVASVRAPDRPYVQGRNLRLFLDAGDDRLDKLRDTLKGRVVFENASVPDLRVYNPYLPRRHMRFDGGAGVLSGDLSLDTAGNVGHGRLGIRGRGARMFLAGIDLQGDVDLDLRLRRADLKQGAFVADGSTVQFRNLGFREPGGGDARSGWWARLRLGRARLDVDRPISAGGMAEVTMKDVGFLLALFSRRKEYPQWVYKLVDAGQAQVDGQVQWRDDVLLLDRVQARNQRFDLEARLRLQGARRRGQLFARWGVLSLGAEVQDQQRKLHLLRARQWYDAQPALLP